jgi:hypothetical protein
MARDHIVGRGASLWMALPLAAFVLACGGKEPAPAKTPPPADAPPAASEARQGTTTPAAAPDGLPTDEELMAYLTWLRDWMQLTHRSKAELDAVTEQTAPKYSLADTGKIVQDPDVVAVIERNGEANKAHFALKPKGRTVDAINATLEGMGLMIPYPGYSGVHDDEKLAQARRRFGDAVVDWVLERESTVASMLSQ